MSNTDLICCVLLVFTSLFLLVLCSARLRCPHCRRARVARLPLAKNARYAYCRCEDCQNFWWEEA